MKRLLPVAMVALVPAMSGCCGGIWPRMTAYRGDSCQSCTSNIYETNPAPLYEGMILPGPTLPAELPGPAEPPA